VAAAAVQAVEGAGDEETLLGGGAAAAADAGAAAESSGSQEAAASKRRQVPQPERTDLDWDFVKQVAAAFVRGLDRKRGEMADKIVHEVADVVRGMTGSADADLAALEQALTKVREARDVQSASERTLQAAARKASDSWAEASAQAVAALLQKELGKISDGVAATLAQQLSQSRKFCEALARGVQKSGGIATKQALEALRPPKQLQETVGSALVEALHESIAPVFRQELRAHFEQELAPLIGQRISDMMVSFRDRMGQCLEGIASEHEQAAQQLGREVVPVVADELRRAEGVLEKQLSARSAASAALTDEQLDELARAVQSEVVQPLQARIHELTGQVRALKQEALRLEERWNACRPVEPASASSLAVPPPPGAGTFGTLPGRAAPPVDPEELQAAELEQTFREGKVSEAFVRAMHLQAAPGARCDFLDRLCSLVPEGGLEEWLTAGGDGGGPLKMQAKMLLMLSLARQLEGRFSAEDVRDRKVAWVNELWFVFDPAEPSVASTVAAFCTNLLEALDRIPPGSCGAEAAEQLRGLKKSVQHATRLLRDR